MVGAMTQAARLHSLDGNQVLGESEAEVEW